MKPHIRQRLRMLRIPAVYMAAYNQYVDVSRLCYQLKRILTTAQQPNQLIYALSLLEQLAGQHALAELHAFKALFELALLRPENSLETLRGGVRARAEPLELLQDIECVLCAVMGESPRIRLFKPKNDVFKASYTVDCGVLNMLQCCHYFAVGLAARRGCTVEYANERACGAIADIYALRLMQGHECGAGSAENAGKGINGSRSTNNRRKGGDYNTYNNDDEQLEADCKGGASRTIGTLNERNPSKESVMAGENDTLLANRTNSTSNEFDYYKNGIYAATKPQNLGLGSSGARKHASKPASARYSLLVLKSYNQQYKGDASYVAPSETYTQSLKALIVTSKAQTTCLVSSRPATAGLARARLIYTRAQTQIHYISQNGGRSKTRYPSEHALRYASISPGKLVCHDYASTFAAETPRYLRASAGPE